LLIIHVNRKSLFFIIKNCRLPTPYCKTKFSVGARLHFANPKKAPGDLRSSSLENRLAFFHMDYMLLDFSLDHEYVNTLSREKILNYFYGPLLLFIEVYGDAVIPKRCEIRIKIHGGPSGFREKFI